MTLTTYINKHYGGLQKDMAADLDVSPSQVSRWISKDYIIIDGVMYSPRRSLEKK